MGINIDWTQTWAVIFTGIIVTFIVLIMLWFFVDIMGKIISSFAANGKKKTTDIAPPTAPIAVKPTNAQDDSEIISVIMAAISAMGAGYTLRSIKRTSDGAEIWAAAGRANNTAGV